MKAITILLLLAVIGCSRNPVQPEPNDELVIVRPCSDCHLPYKTEEVKR